MTVRLSFIKLSIAHIARKGNIFMNFEKYAASADQKEQKNPCTGETLRHYLHKIVLKGKRSSLEPENNIWLAPLAGVTDLAFRRTCKECGAMLGEPQAAPGLVFTEMISAKGVHYKGNNSIRLADTDPHEAPLSVQLFGSEPEIIGESAALFRDLGAPAIDINMGCPMRKITSNGEGSALLKQPNLIEKIVAAAADASGIPVTVKIRRGYEIGTELCTEAALAAEAGGAAAVTVHGRYRDEYYSGTCHLDAIAHVKQAVKIPVIGNGDITDFDSACKMFRETGCDGIMIGRAALGRPWIFCRLLGAKNAAELPAAFLSEIIKKHLSYAILYKGEKQGVQEMRKHLAWYTKGFRGAAAVRDRLFKAGSAEEAVTILEEFTGALTADTAKI